MIILLVDGNYLAGKFIKDGLSSKGFEVDITGDGFEGLGMFERGSYDLVILDISLPHMDGFELCRQMRSRRKDLPILILSGRRSTADTVAGLGSGADDYLLKPFYFEELLARIHALLRWRFKAGAVPYQVGDLEVDPVRRMVKRAGRPIQLTATEFSLLLLLITHKNKTLSRTFISASVWSVDFERTTNIVSVFINSLRKKIDKGFDHPLIHTVVNEGYTLKDP